MSLGSEPISAFAHEATARKIAQQLAPISIFSYQDFFGAAMTVLFEFDRKKRPISEEQLIAILTASRDMATAHDRSLGSAVYPLLDLIFPREVIL